MGINNALQLAELSPSFIRKQFSVVVERTVRELNGIPCLGLEEFTAPKNKSYAPDLLEKNRRTKSACIRPFALMLNVQQKNSVQSINFVNG